MLIAMHWAGSQAFATIGSIHQTPEVHNEGRMEGARQQHRAAHGGQQVDTTLLHGKGLRLNLVVIATLLSSTQPV
jgi:hypothetical protein